MLLFLWTKISDPPKSGRRTQDSEGAPVSPIDNAEELDGHVLDAAAFRAAAPWRSTLPATDSADCKSNGAGRSSHSGRLVPPVAPADVDETLGVRVARPSCPSGSQPSLQRAGSLLLPEKYSWPAAARNRSQPSFNTPTRATSPSSVLACSQQAQHRLLASVAAYPLRNQPP